MPTGITMLYRHALRWEGKVKETRYIRIGNQTALAASSITEPFRYAIVNGFDAFEWFPDTNDSGKGWTESNIKKKARALIRKIAIDHDINLSVHAPWQANPLELKDREILIRNIEFAIDIGATLINTHFFSEQGVDAYVEAVAPLIKLMSKEGIKLSIENTPTTGPEIFNQLFEKFRVDDTEEEELVGMCLDLGHANLYPKTLNNYIRFTDLLDGSIPIIHVHIHENYGDHDSHLPLFTGPAGKDPSGIGGLLDRLNDRCFSGAIILEQWPHTPRLLDAARNRLTEMILKRFTLL